MIDIEKLVAATKRAAELANESDYSVTFDARGEFYTITFGGWDAEAGDCSVVKTKSGIGCDMIAMVEKAYAEAVDGEREYYAKKRVAEDTANELDYLRSRNKQLEEEIRMLQGR